MIDILSSIFLLVGAGLGIIGGIGIHRFPDFYTRLHAIGITDTLSALMILLGLALQAGWSIAAFKLALIFVFLFFSSPTASHALANAAQHSGLKPKLDQK
ncbi:MAG: monovalent cation/H(+) antiporter subunit G [Candidatus Thiodiazotropha lotti]|uniref:Monovalent cation/H(+) antiporter subunit G n=1 Tax=Candidatus Thiodiazotropha lotti TaxID=2792787 RepID=A0A9E4K658_9GAMM|nr:monovalent cation/H(+) antiporter subunit G [Candidatus Thiodiazotropha lotti]ODC01952.1 sodium:proton antiporter [Candidatus Thiodiazotropha endoloripes]MCG7920528.1 monovalent cation/H(+) antiporter subunit G [Candidatus Thiodiazotropha lotti]MCG7930572.1 monovalent cation/H(+) antiporter subunit G [Candidatus Thiodiazotropha lotti]MCG7940150.1 monovalent cation/H(+) antiporter subunit G [Candidatus Thiodiazotropha lotti]